MSSIRWTVLGFVTVTVMGICFLAVFAFSHQYASASDIHMQSTFCDAHCWWNSTYNTCTKSVISNKPPLCDIDDESCDGYTECRKKSDSPDCSCELPNQ